MAPSIRKRRRRPPDGGAALPDAIMGGRAATGAGSPVLGTLASRLDPSCMPPMRSSNPKGPAAQQPRA
ncbi:hypothetical protein [Falsiroseomonas sp.]|jgi:hypothetical protein|uniref:hypothetical protein n=1 Tax=Falsiroseomonas sp. TaxID=2870721 RepID=UPI0034A2FAE1